MELTSLQLLKFFHRNDIYSIQQPTGAYYPVRKQITLTEIERHKRGEITLGAYCLNKDETCRWACVDLDGKDLLKMRKEAQQIFKLIEIKDLVKGKMIEFSGRRGYHVWVFFKEPVPAPLAQKYLKARLTQLNLSFYEVFPKQTQLTGKGYGNLVKLPMALHRKSNRYSKIITLEGEI